MIHSLSIVMSSAVRLGYGTPKKTSFLTEGHGDGRERGCALRKLQGQLGYNSRENNDRGSTMGNYLNRRGGAD